MRVGQKNKLTYRWARKVHVPAPATINVPSDLSVRREAMQLHLNEIATKVTPGAHAILILDQAGWHGAKELEIPSNISLLPLPPRAPSSTAKKTSGSSCGRAGSQTASSNPSTISSITAATPGTP
jgi:hypothetical protein